MQPDELQVEQPATVEEAHRWRAYLIAVLEPEGDEEVAVYCPECADELWNGLVDGSVRVRPLIVGQSAETQSAIRMHFDQLLEEYRTEDGLAVPVSVSSLRRISRDPPEPLEAQRARDPS